MPAPEGPFPWSGQRIRKMNSTSAEFRRALVQAFSVAVSEVEAGLLLTTESAVLRFTLTEGESYQVGTLRIPLLQVEISVLRGDDASARKLQERVDRATQRGGG